MGRSTILGWVNWRKTIIFLFLTLLVTLAASGILYTLRQVIDPLPIALLFLLPVGLCAAVWGLTAGIMAAILAFLSLNYFFIEPYFTFLVHQSQDVIVLLIFLGVAIFISQMVGRTQDSLAVARAREQEAIRLYKFSAELAELHEDLAIAESIARIVKETFHALSVEVNLEADAGRPEIIVRLPEEPFEASPTFSTVRVPLQKPEKMIGEIRLARLPMELTPAEERLLQTFSYQGVLALERARLIQAETRARVLEESDRMKSSLLSSVSHELRTPLATIKAASTSLSSAAVDWESEARQELLEAIEEETDHLNLLVGNLLDMSRIESGALNPQRHWTALDEVVESTLQRMRTAIRNQKLVVQVPGDLPLVYVDDVQIGQVFTNLISNSLKFAPVNSLVRIHALKNDNQAVEIQVVNQGPPVPDADLGLIFEKFHRVTTGNRVTGIGLGLSICKGIIEAHGGRIWAENLPEGFAIKFTLPSIWMGQTPHVPEDNELSTAHPRD